MMIYYFKNTFGMPIKNGISAQSYYEILEWKDSNMKMFSLLHPNKRVTDLTKEELESLFEAIVESRINKK